MCVLEDAVLHRCPDHVLEMLLRRVIPGIRNTTTHNITYAHNYVELTRNVYPKLSYNYRFSWLALGCRATNFSHPPRTHTHTHTHTRAHTRTHMHTHTHTHAHTHTYMYTHAHTHTYMYTHTHLRVRSLWAMGAFLGPSWGELWLILGQNTVFGIAEIGSIF